MTGKKTVLKIKNINYSLKKKQLFDYQFLFSNIIYKNPFIYTQRIEDF